MYEKWILVDVKIRENIEPAFALVSHTKPLS